MSTTQNGVATTQRNADNPLVMLGAAGQSIWLDYIRRDLIESGDLAKMIAKDGLAGMTSNPAIFERERDVTGEAVVVPAKMALSLSMVLHELTTNAIKYGALCGDAGRIHIQVSTESSDCGAMLSILWIETGVGTCAKPERSGFGSRLIERVIQRELGGAFTAEYPSSGAAYALRIPLPLQG